MVKSFDSNEKNMILHEASTLSLKKDDIVVIKVDQTKFNYDEIKQLIQSYMKIINNPIMVTFDGIEFSKIANF